MIIDAHNYLLFIGASVLLAVVPGPDMAYLLARSIAQGPRVAAVAAVGMNIGGYCYLAAAILGLSAILATSLLAFTLVKWVGAAYLVYLGLQALLRSGKQHTLASLADSTTTRSLIRAISARAAFMQGFLNDVLNPKVALFFFALLPQFVAVNSDNKVLQLVILGITVNGICLIINLGIVYLSATITRRLRQSRTVSLWLNRAMGCIFIALGIRLTTEKF